MKKILKYSFLSLLILLVLIAGVVGYFLTTFNPNEYKPKIIQTIKDKQNRTLKLDGDIKLTFFPNIGAKLENISLSEFNSDKEFATIANAHVSLALFPLLTKQVVVNEVGLSGAKVKVIKFKNGTSNLDDLISKKEVKDEPQPQTESRPEAAVKFDIAEVKIENTELSYRDESTGAQYSIKDLNLTTGRIANGIPGKINLDVVLQANKPKLDIAAKIQTMLTFDLEKQYIQMEGLDMQIKGIALDMSNLQINATGNVSVNLATQAFTSKKLVVSASGIKGKDNLNASLNMPAFVFTRDKVTAEKLVLNANLEGGLGKVVAALTLQDLQGNAASFKSSGLVLDVDLKQVEQTFKLKVATPLVGSLDAKQLNLSNLIFSVNATGDKLPNKSLSSEMKGSVQVDAGRESMQLNLAGGLLQSQVKAKMALKNFSEPVIRFDVDIDQFDADIYLPKKSAATSVKAEALPEEPFDLSVLQKLNIEGGLRMGALKIANVKSSQLRIDVKANKGQLNVSPLSANLYQGSMNGSIVVNAFQAKPVFTIKQNLSGINLGPLIKDALDIDMVEGNGNVTVNLATQGNTITALKKGLNGMTALNLHEGAIKGINLTKLVRGAQNLGQGGGVQTLKPAADDKTEFSELKANFKVTNGVAHNDDMLVKSQSLRITGNGDVDIGNSSINYMTKTTLAESVDGKTSSLTVPVQLQGPFADMKFKVDYAAVVVDVVKQKAEAKIDAKKEELKQQLQEKLKGGLKGLFK